MTVFQIVFITLCATQALFALTRFIRARHAVTLLYCSLWVGAMALAVYPEVSNRLARSVGIGRGVDVVIYALLAVYLWAHYQHYVRYKRVESHITELVRTLAVIQAMRPSEAGRPPVCPKPSP